jgi:hypothetical protein
VSLATPKDCRYAFIVCRVVGVQPCISFSYSCSLFAFYFASFAAASFASISAFSFAAASFASISAFNFAAAYSSYFLNCLISLQSVSLFSSLYF